MELKLAAAYVRVSTDDQTEYSPDSQLKIIRDHASKDGYLLPEDLIFQEDAISGRRADKRPQFQLLIARAKEPDPGFDRIYVWEFSRFARNQEESIVYKNLLRKRGITVQSIKEPLADSPFASLIERIIEWMDEYYLINLATEVKRGLQEKVSRGEPIGSAPFGYSYDATTKSYIINEEEAVIVRYIFSAYSNGQSISGITKELNRTGAKTHNGNPLERRWVRYLLENPAYISKLRWSPDGKANYSRPSADLSRMQLIPASHEPIIQESLFQNVQERLSSNSEPRNTAHRGEDFMLRGLLKCSACGSTLSRTRLSDPKRPVALQCVSYTAGKCTVSHYLSMNKAEESVIDYLESIVLNDSYVIQKQAIVENPPSLQWERMISAEERRISRARTAYLDGTFSLDEYTSAKSEAEANISKFKAALASAPPDPKPHATTMRKKVIHVLQIIKDPTISQTAKNEALHLIIDHIVYDKKDHTMQVYFRP